MTGFPTKVNTLKSGIWLRMSIISTSSIRLCDTSRTLNNQTHNTFVILTVDHFYITLHCHRHTTDRKTGWNHDRHSSTERIAFPNLTVGHVSSCLMSSALLRWLWAICKVVNLGRHPVQYEQSHLAIWKGSATKSYQCFVLHLIHCCWHSEYIAPVMAPSSLVLTADYAAKIWKSNDRQN
jgi:hypothetical protein